MLPLRGWGSTPGMNAGPNIVEGTIVNDRGQSEPAPPTIRLWRTVPGRG
jgi:hypothetical protein